MAKQIFERVVKAAEGAALGTGTTMDYEIIDGDYDILPNKVLSVAMQKNLEMVGGITYTEKEIEFGKKIQSTFNYKAPPIEAVSTISPLSEFPGKIPASSDVGDVSWNVPTVGLGAATWIPGTPAHSWQAVACGGTDIGAKGMMVAAKAMTLMGIDLLLKKELVTQAAEEFNKDRGEGFIYKALLGDRKPALDYRDKK
jgi:aminobenzoyl-glutamate utilization protein B